MHLKHPLALLAALALTACEVTLSAPSAVTPTPPFITATLPSNRKHAPYADIDTDRVKIIVDDKCVTVMLDHTVDRVHSFYRVHRGLMDISLKKIKNL